MVKAVLGKKLGMTQYFDNNGERVGVTVIEVGPCTLLEKVSYATKISAKIGYGQDPGKEI